MDHAGGTARTLDPLETELRDAIARTPNAAADRIGRQLARGASPDQATPESLRIDRAIVESLAGASNPDAVLDRLDIDELGALVDRCAARLSGADDSLESRRLAWRALDLVRRPAVARRIPRTAIGEWSHRILAVVEASHFTLGMMFRERVERYGTKTLLQLSPASGSTSLNWRQVASRVELLARGLLALDEEVAPIAILSENRVEMALTDLACLTTGLLNVMLPAPSTERDVGYTLRHSRVRTVVVSGSRQLDKVLANRDSLPDLKQIVTFDPVTARDRSVLTLDQLVAGGNAVPVSAIASRAEAVRIDDRATVMYTSGTTGTPKGIEFSQRNLVFKRFARALALPEIGDGDVFMCYLPLFHTFGRFLELLGCVFWGATYCFLDNPSIEALVRGMRWNRPTVFISVPKKWIQLHEAITRRADPMTSSDEQLRQATRDVTGGRLAWGLSAAGHLDPEIFRFFQDQGIELMSGFGMTEATGGITMTPPGEYREDSLGVALPGIDVKLADDGELLVRGPYVMLGYLDPEDGEPSFDAEGWLHSGDLMEYDETGHLRIVGRKKEIYKNIKGETIAPQRIENLFRDFDSVTRTFLVGDRREYNTLLIYPNSEYEQQDFGGMPAEQVREHFRSLVVSVNKFLSPYERVVEFAVIDRDLDAGREELTPKGTPRRQTVVRNFAGVIDGMYQRADLNVADVQVTIPNWLFQAVGLTVQDLRVDESRIELPPHGTHLTIGRIDDETARIGSCLYTHPPGPLSLGALFRSPRLWLGNEQLVDFVALDPSQRRGAGRTEEGIRWGGRAEPIQVTSAMRDALAGALEREEHELMDVDLAARALAAEDDPAAIDAVRLLQRIVSDKEGPLSEPARLVLARGAEAPSIEVRRRSFLALAPYERDDRFRRTLERFLVRNELDLDGDMRAALCEYDLSADKVEALIQLAQRDCLDEAEGAAPSKRAVSVLRLLSAYGAVHPARYRRTRAFLVRMGLAAIHEETRRWANEGATALLHGFREWLRPSSSIAVDPETGREYRWPDVMVVDESIDAGDRDRLIDAVQNTAMLREAVFLFSKGSLIRLSDIPPGGVWIRPLGSRHGKCVVRITVQTRFQGAFDLAVNINHDMAQEHVDEEIQWLILGGDSSTDEPLVEVFGGYWPEQGLWSEEFISGETLDHSLRRLSRRPDEGERLRALWPFLAWTALMAYVGFWHRTGQRWVISDPSLSNVVVPTDDYHTGVRLVSVSARRENICLHRMMRLHMEEFIRPAERLYPSLGGLASWDVILSAVLEVVGEEAGLAMLREARARHADDLTPEEDRALNDYIDAVEARGFLPRRLFFAAKRYRRWERLSPDATPQARARTLRELYDTYGLQRLARDYPETRIRLFRGTVFRKSAPVLTERLEQLIARVRGAEVSRDELIDTIADLRSSLDLGPDEDYFLARMSLPHLRPEDSAGFVTAVFGGRHQSEIVVTLEDLDGRGFRVRHALNPKEVGALHRLILASKLDVQFRIEHRYLVAISDRNLLIGGIYYEIEEGGETAHLEKIVVAEPYRRMGVASGLMNEFFNRLRAAGVKTVTTGFFRPQYFYGYGFRIEGRYAGLVKSLEDAAPDTD